jgi:TonB-dependent receptor
MEKKRFLRCFTPGGIDKIARRMKLVTFLLLIVFAAGAANSYSQATKFSLGFRDVSLREVFNQIEENSEFIILYNEKSVNLSNKVNFDVQDETVEVVLDKAFKGTKYSYKIYDRQIVIFEDGLKPPTNPEFIHLAQPEQPQGNGSIIGKIVDEINLPLIGATIYIARYKKGTVTDANGNYQLLGVPAGKHTVKFSFIGFEEQVREVEVIRGEVVTCDVKLTSSTTGMEEVVVFGQARGQQAAIQQQINSAGIVNVVSAEKLRELPDVNVAEAVGRLPGLMVERNRGEGQKIIIRGLEPKYNAISIGGNIVPSTSTDDRSTDLNMISPDILGGVEVQKAITADKDASGLGGTVNLTLREAPTGFKLNAGIQSGYSSFTKSISNYHGNFYLSNRYFRNKLGLMLTGNFDIAERNSDRLGVTYNVSGVPNYDQGQTFITPWVTNMQLQANIEDRNRAGGSVLLDWKISPSSKIKSSNFIGYLNRNFLDRTREYNLASNYLMFRQFEGEINQVVLSNSLEGKHMLFGSLLVDWGLSRSQSINNKPYEHNVYFQKQSGFNNLAVGRSYDIGPPELIPSPGNVNDFQDQFFWANGNFRTYESEETESSYYLNLEAPFKIGKSISGNIKAGTRYRLKERFRNNVRYNRPMDTGGSHELFLKEHPDYILTTEGVVGEISMVNFLDNNYKPVEYLNGQYPYLNVDRVLDRKLLHNLYDECLKDIYHFIASGAKDDYFTEETINSYYLMSEINIGEFITFIPGVRYEKTNIEYGAYIAEEITEDERTPIEVDFRDTLATNQYMHILPQIHLRIKPTDWFDIRLAYTNTLSRPDYGQLAPKRLINMTTKKVSMGNTGLNPALSRNYDVILTFYKQKYGLLTLGAFYKDIDGFLWTRDAMIVAGTATDPSNLKLPESTLGFDITYPLNSPNRASIKGFELDLQSNMDFLSIKGFVFNLNLSLMNSTTKYSETLKLRTLNPDYGKIPGVPRVIFVNYDTAYVDRLLKQPGYLANIGLGYDNKKIGLSVRMSVSYQDEILTREQRRTDGADRGMTTAFNRWDFQMNQRITKRLSLNANIANMFNRPDKSIRCITGYIENLEYYGATAQVGLRYDFY